MDNFLAKDNRQIPVVKLILWMNYHPSVRISDALRTERLNNNASCYVMHAYVNISDLTA